MVLPREKMIMEVVKKVNENYKGEVPLKPRIKKDYCTISFVDADEKELVLLLQTVRNFFRKHLYLWLDDKETENGTVSELKFFQKQLNYKY